MRTRRLILTASILGIAAVLSGCATTAATSPTGSPSADPIATQTPGAETEVTPGAGTADPDAVTAGRISADGLIGIVTFGSGSCVPVVENVDIADDTFTVTLSDGEPRPCTMDYSPRVTPVFAPEDLEIDSETTFTVIYNDITAELPLAASVTGSAGPYATTAGYVGPGAIGVVTYGSSTCVPRVATVDEADGLLTVTFAAGEEGKACTEDMAPRVTMVQAGDGVDEMTLIDEQGKSQTMPVIANSF